MRAIVALVSLLSWSMTSFSQSASDKLEAYFSFDNNCKAVDDSGNGSVGALINGVSCSCGLIDSCMSFNGTNGTIYFVGPFADVFSTSDFTISFYMKTPEFSNVIGTQVIMSKQAGCSTSKAFWVRYSPKNRRIASGISENDTLLTTVQAQLDPGPCWQFITITRSNTKYSLYVNGALKDAKNGPARYNLTSNATFKIGEPVCPLDSWFKGEIDELRFFSKALSPEAIKPYNLHADNILNADTLIYLGNSFKISLESNCAEQYLWQPFNGVSDPYTAEPVITPTAPGFYSVSIAYGNGECVANDTIQINVIDPDTLDCNKIFLPNAFTPNSSSGRNDVFGISNPFSIQEFISFEIFDRWGGKIFAAETPFETWDGVAYGTAANPGVYLYRLRYRCQGITKSKSGNLTLLR